VAETLGEHVEACSPALTEQAGSVFSRAPRQTEIDLMQAFSQIVEQKHGVQRGSAIEPPANPSIDLIRAVAEDYLEEARANIAASVVP
jgi:hypothetical protein